MKESVMKYSTEEKQLHIELWRESGLSKTEYAHEIGISRQIFYSWFRGKKSNSSSKKFVQVVSTDNTNELINSSDIILYSPSGYKIVVQTNCTAALLERVVNVLDATHVS